MGISQGISCYQDVQFQTTDPAKLILLLFQRLETELNQAQEMIQKRNIAGKGRAIVKSQDIIMELFNCLDVRAGLIAKNLQSLYLYMFRELNNINLYNDLKKMDVVIKITDDLKTAWEEITTNRSIKKNEKFQEANVEKVALVG